MFEAAILEEINSPRFNPPAFVEQLRMLPFARLTDAIVREFEADFKRDSALRDDALVGIAELTRSSEFKNDGEEFRSIVESFERQADEIGMKLKRLEKQVRKAQRLDPGRAIDLDERMLKLAREDFEDRIDMAMFFRAMQAQTWPTPVSGSFATGSDIGASLRAALG